MSHIFLFYLFYRDFDPCLQVFGHFHQAKLALAKRFLKLIKVKNIAVAHNLLKLLFPGLFFTFCWKVEISLRIRRNIYFEFKVTSLRTFFLFKLFNFGVLIFKIAEVAAGQTVHVLVVFVWDFFVDVNFVSFKWEEMRNELLSV